MERKFKNSCKLYDSQENEEIEEIEEVDEIDQMIDK